MKRFYSILLFALAAASCIQDRECPTNLPDAPKLSVDETSVTRVSMVVDGSFGKNMTDVTSYGVEISETLFETGGTYKTLIPQEVGNNGFSLGVTDLKTNSTYFLRTFISNGYSKMYSSVITQQTPETSVASLSDVTVRDNHYLVATIEDNGGRTVEEVGFMWGTSSQRKDIKREKRYPGTLSEDGKTFTLPLAEVGQGTYYVLAYAEDDRDGTGYSRIPLELALGEEEYGSLDGRWDALRHENEPGSTAFVALFDGEHLDLYIIAWGQHYLGRYSYADGVITYDIESAQQAYTDVSYDQEGNMVSHSWAAGNLDPTTLQLGEGYEWYHMNEEDLSGYKEDLAQFSFIRQDNNTATSALFGIDDLVFRKVN